MSARLFIVADVHHGPPSATKRGDEALRLLEGFVRFVGDGRPDAVLELGDRITDTDPEADRRRMGEVAAVLQGIDAPVYGVDGNHDRDHLSAADCAAIMGRSAASETVDVGGWRMAIWRADPRIRRGPGLRGFVLPEPDFLWLAGVIANADRPLLLVSHVPVSGREQTGNYYFENNPAFGNYPEWRRVRALLQRAVVPVVCLAGHVHWNTLTFVDGVVHLTQQSLTESFTTAGAAAGATGILELGDRRVRWQVLGEDPVEVTLPVRAPRWVPCLPAFGEARGLRRPSAVADLPDGPATENAG